MVRYTLLRMLIFFGCLSLLWLVGLREPTELPWLVVTAAIAHARQLRTPDRAAERLGSDPALRARHVALLPPAPPDAPVVTRLPAIAAGAKIAVASSRVEALAFLDQPERRALFSDAELLAQWAALPR
mgnify:CR=1 FL=1